MILKDKDETYEIEFPETLKGMVEKFGEDSVYHMAEREYIQAVRNFISRKKKDGFLFKEIQEGINSYQPRFNLKTRLRRYRKVELFPEKEKE